MAERVWDQFLTEQDKAHLAARPQGGRIGFGGRPALLLIDLYRGVYGDQPEPLLEAIKTWPQSCGIAAWDAIPALQRLLAAARAERIPVIYSTGLDDIPAWNRKGSRRPASDTPEALDRERRKYDIIDEVAPVDGEVVFRKASPSVFWGTPLAGYLQSLGVDTLIVGGESTSGCVRATVVDGCTYRLNMMVVEDCVFDRHEACHAIDLFDMNQKYSDVVSLDETLEWLQEWRAAHPVGQTE